MKKANDTDGNAIGEGMPEGSIAELIEMSTTGDTRVWTIGELARECDVTLRALRFYEGKGLLTPRRDNSARLYGAEERRRLALVLRGKRVGLSLIEIREILGLASRSGDLHHRLEVARRRLERQVGVLEEQRADVEASLAAVHTELAALAARVRD